MPSAYRDILAPKGRLVAIVGQEPIMEATLLMSQKGDDWVTTSLFDTLVRPLLNVESPDGFIF